METILKQNIKLVRAILRLGAKVEVSTQPIPPHKGTPFRNNLPEISFGVSDVNTSLEFIPCYYEITESGTLLSIYTQYDDNYKVFLYTPSSFKIFLPPDCYLLIEYLD